MQTTPTITWATPAAISYGTLLSATQLNATGSVSGTMTYSPVAGTVLSAGTGEALQVTFTPADTTDYTTATDTVCITVNKVTSTITWAAPAAITYGTALSATQLNATGSVAGTMAYSPVSGAVLSAGTNQALQVTFTPTDTTDYTTATATVSITVNKAASTITWLAPAAITYGTALSTTQLSATGSVAGTMTYNPVAGTVLSAGANQALQVTFRPTDTTDYTTATATVYITVNAVASGPFGMLSLGAPLGTVAPGQIIIVPVNFTDTDASGNSLNSSATLQDLEVVVSFDSTQLHVVPGVFSGPYAVDAPDYPMVNGSVSLGKITSEPGTDSQDGYPWAFNTVTSSFLDNFDNTPTGSNPGVLVVEAFRLGTYGLPGGTSDFGSGSVFLIAFQVQPGADGGK